MKKIAEGIYAAALTPMHPDLSPNCEELATHCFDLLKRGCQGVALFGTTGEGPSFSLNERIDTLQKVIAQGLDPKRIILGNGSASIPDTVDLALAALKLNCTTLLIAPPSFYKKVPEEGVIAYYREILQRVPNPKLRVILYHIPQYSGVPLTIPIVRTLRKEFPEIVIGLKESEGNIALTQEILKELPEMQIFVGNESQIIEAVHQGGSGAICGMANLYPELIVMLYHEGKKGLRPNPQEAEDIFLSLKKQPFIPSAKSIMEAKRGKNWGIVRPPLR